MAMGIAEIIPGVSGGTIAFITGIYERFIAALHNIDLSLFVILKKEGISGVWKKIDGNFLASLAAGMFASILLFVKLVTHLIETQPVMLWAFFFGLIVASAIYVARQIQEWNIANIITLLIGAGIAYYITIAAPANGNDALWFVFFSGMVAISAMLLPGLSGSFILLLMGMYGIVLGGVKNMDLIIIATFALGCITGILSFSKILNWAFKHHKSMTLAGLTGFIIGSLNRVWPWQEVLSRRVNSKGHEVVEFTRSVLPGKFAALNAADNMPYGNDPQIWVVIALMAVGFGVVLVLERTGKK
ncbi:MAG TPA: DUF368 domain-containing protein [Bacteroidetes bacterium]|nr:DUF368 domain-containing protein [Bacteroidota bacterium]